MIRPILNNTKVLLGAAALVAGSMVGIVQCSSSAKKSNVDLTTCHDVNLSGDTIKIQDGVSLELKSKTYLMNNGKLMVYDKESETWSDAEGKINKIYDYQKQTFIDIAKTVSEAGDTLVLSKEDIQYIQDEPEELYLNNDYRHPVDATISGGRYREVKDTEGNSIVIDASEDSYSVRHSTPELTVSYDMNEETAVE